VQEYLDGQVSLSEAFEFAIGRFLPLLGTSLLVGICVMFGMALCCVPGIYMAVIWQVIAQVVVVEKMSGTQAMSRSSELVKGHWWQVFVLVFFLGLFNFCINFGLTFGLTAALPHRETLAGPNPFLPVVPGPVNNYPNFAIVTIVPTLVGDIIGAYIAICVTFLYFELRRRKEGYDLREGYARIARWRERWDAIEEEPRLAPPAAGSPSTGIKEPGVQPPWQPPETGIKDSDAGPPGA
jgi:hypothetical protein